MTISTSPGKVWYDSGMSVTQNCLTCAVDIFFWLVTLVWDGFVNYPLRKDIKYFYHLFAITCAKTLTAAFTISKVLNENIWEKVHYSQKLLLEMFMVNQFFFSISFTLEMNTCLEDKMFCKFTNSHSWQWKKEHVKFVASLLPPLRTASTHWVFHSVLITLNFQTDSLAWNCWLMSRGKGVIHPYAMSNNIPRCHLLTFCLNAMIF